MNFNATGDYFSNRCFTLYHYTSNTGPGRVVDTFKTFDYADRIARDMVRKAVQGTDRKVHSCGAGHYVVSSGRGVHHILRVVEGD